MKHIKYFENIDDIDFDVWDEEEDDPDLFDIEDVKDVKYLIVCDDNTIDIYYRNNRNQMKISGVILNDKFLTHFKDDITSIADETHYTIYYSKNIKKLKYRLLASDLTLMSRLKKLVDKLNIVDIDIVRLTDSIKRFSPYRVHSGDCGYISLTLKNGTIKLNTI